MKHESTDTSRVHRKQAKSCKSSFTFTQAIVGMLLALPALRIILTTN